MSDLTIKNIDKLFKTITEQTKRPIAVKIKHNDRGFQNELNKLKTSIKTEHALLYGLPVFVDEEMEPGIVRFQMADGSYTDINLWNKRDSSMIIYGNKAFENKNPIITDASS